MIQLKKYTSPAEAKALVILCDKKSKLPVSIEQDVKTFLKGFLKSDDKFDFLKTINGLVFFVKKEQSAEQIRVAGYKVVSQLKKEISALTIWGEEDEVVHFTEGLLLSSYQFLPYFKDAEKRKNGLVEILLPNEISDKKMLN